MTSKRRPLANRSWVDDDSSKSVATERVPFRVVSYNVLAQSLIRYGPFLEVPSKFRKLAYRVDSLCSEILSYEADIICLQENDMHSTSIWPRFARDFDGVFSGRPSNKSDGCSVYWRSCRFELVSMFCVHMDTLCRFAAKSFSYKYGNRNVGLVVVLRDKAVDRLICVGNVHVFWNPAFPEVKLAQTMYLARCMLDTKHSYQHVDRRDPVIVLCGDFNSLPLSSVYNLLAGTMDSVTSTPEWPLLCEDFGGVEPFRALVRDVFVGTPPSHLSGLASTYMKYRKIAHRKSLLTEARLKDTPPTFYINHARDGANCDEPEYTNFTRDFVGTLDYVWYDREKLVVHRVLELLPQEYLSLQTALPNEHFSSDHLALVADMDYRKL